MNRLNTFLSISALSLASSASIAVADTKDFESKKVDSVTSSLVDSQEQTRNHTVLNQRQDQTKK